MSKVFKLQPIEFALVLTEREGQGKKLSEETVPERVQLMRSGIFTYWDPGDMVLSKEVFECFVKNFQNKVRGVDLAIDYGHQNSREAAGWIKNLAMDSDGSTLWADVKWTPRGEKLLKEKEYRYLSAEFAYDWEDEKGTKHGPCLFGAGLTNRPFLKNMKPVMELSELSKEKKMDLEKEVKALTETLKSLSEKIGTMEAALKEKDEKIKALSDKQSDREKSAQLEERKAAFDVMFKEGKVVEAQREAYMQGDVKKFAELQQPITLEGKGSSVDKKPESGKSADQMTNEEAEDALLAKAKALHEEKKGALSWKDCVTQVKRENPKLAEKQEAMFV